MWWQSRSRKSCKHMPASIRFGFISAPVCWYGERSQFGTKPTNKSDPKSRVVSGSKSFQNASNINQNGPFGSPWSLGGEQKMSKNGSLHQIGSFCIHFWEPRGCQMEPRGPTWSQNGTNMKPNVVQKSIKKHA